MTTCFGLYFLRSSSGRKYSFFRKLYNVYGVTSVNLNCHDCKQDLIFSIKLIQGQSTKKLNFFFNLLLYLQLNQTCLHQSTPVHS